MKNDFVELRKGFVGENKVPVFKINKGHCRTGLAIASDGSVAFMLCVTDQYGEPGSAVKTNEEILPLVGLEVWGAEQLRILAKCCEMAADKLDELERKAAENADNA